MAKHRPTRRSGHAPRSVRGSRDDPDTVLDRLPYGTSDYVRVIGAILEKYNTDHASKHKSVSFKTMQNRSIFLVQFFRELRKETRFNNVDPRQLGERHVLEMIDRWKSKGLSTGTVHNYLCYLRTFSAWIGKPGMVKPPSVYFDGSIHERRSQVAKVDRSWSSNGVDVEAKIAEVMACDRRVGQQLALCALFGMRGKEARHFRPHEAVVSRNAANENDAAAFPECETFVRINQGTKGGRARDVPLQTDAQRALLAQLRQELPLGAFVGHPGLTSVQARNRFYNVIRKFGITKAGLGVIAHGLRHQHVNDLYSAEAGGPSPVRGATELAPLDAYARERAARRMGHNRSSITSAYLGR